MRHKRAEGRRWIANLIQLFRNMFKVRVVELNGLTSPEASCSEHEDRKLKKTKRTQFREQTSIDQESSYASNARKVLNHMKCLLSPNKPKALPTNGSFDIWIYKLGRARMKCGVSEGEYNACRSISSVAGIWTYFRQMLVEFAELLNIPGRR
jgi:hypothetical protein